MSGKRTKASADAALAIALSPEMRKSAFDNFKQTVFSPGTVATKNARTRLWDRLCEALGFPQFPVSPESLLGVAAILKEAGYRCGYLYLVEARQAHIRLGFPIGAQLELAMADAKRSLERGMGAPTRSAEVRPSVWDELHMQVTQNNSKTVAQFHSSGYKINHWF